jgi:internalin A
MKLNLFKYKKTIFIISLSLAILIIFSCISYYNGIDQKKGIKWVKGNNGTVGFKDQGLDNYPRLKNFVEKYYGKNIYFVSIRDQNIKDLALIEGLTNVEQIDFSWSQLPDLTPLSSLKKLHELDLSNTSINDFSSLKKIMSLKRLSLLGTMISNINYLTSLTQLSLLSLGNTKIIDISPLKELTQLKTLSLAGTKVTDFSPLKALTQLEDLDLRETPLNDLTPLKNLSKLILLQLSNTYISLEQVKELQLSLPNCEIIVEKEVLPREK